ncbi:LysE family translocator [Sneathiella limimaris]|uniref:LysE family translocator n=1 Tax=Sneathiella limimaris TaxID=1964213 RepID=UPI00146E8718|nr:LysE family translocator [Sneathiella limimaris]
MSPEFLLTALIVVLAPGTGVIYTVAIGLSKGRSASIAAAFGCTMGIIPHLLASILGLAAILHTSALLFESIKYAGVAYLLYLAWQVLKGNGTISLQSSEAEKSRSIGKLISTGFLINILNPKLSIFFLAFLPQFILPGTPTPSQDMGVLGLVFMLLTFGVFVIYGLFAATLSRHILSRPSFLKWFNRGLAGVFVALSAKLALTER